MGTEVHYRSLFSEHNKMRDLNEDVGDDTWPSLYISKTHNDHFYNGCFPSPLNGFSIYDKEMLKRIMLEHEAIFKKQVYELHRLYSIQKDMMTELQKNGFSAFSKNEVPVKTFSCSSQVHSEYFTGMLQMPHPPTMNISQQIEKARYTNDIISQINFIDRNLIPSSDFLNTRIFERVSQSDCFKECLKRKFDPRFPAAACIDDTERSEKVALLGSSSTSANSFPGICSRDFHTKLRHNFVNGNGSSRKNDVDKMDYLNKKNIFTGPIDLNEPNTQKTLERVPISLSAEIRSSRTRTEENLGLQIPYSNTVILQKASSKYKDCVERTFSEVFTEGKEMSKGICHNESGNLFPISSKNSILTIDKDLKLYEPVQLKTRQGSNIISIDKASARFGHKHDAFRNLGNASFSLPCSFSSSLELESNMNSFPLASTILKSSKDENLGPSPFSTISNFDDFIGSSRACQFGIDLNSPQSFEEKSSVRLDGLSDGLHVLSRSSLQIKLPITDINLNVESESSFSGNPDGHPDHQRKAANCIDGKCESFLPELSLLRRKPAFESLEPNSLPSLINSGFSKMTQIYEGIDEVKVAGMSHGMKMCATDKSACAVNDNRRHWNCIDLNSVSPLADDSDSSDTSRKAQKAAPLFGLEAQISKQQEDNITTDSSRKALQKDLCSHEMCIKEAAVNILKLSLDEFKNKYDIHGSMSVAPLSDALHFLAEMILSIDTSLEMNAYGLDHFELMTIQLKEEKPEKLWCKPQEAEIVEMNKRSKASLLIAKPRRMLGKKRRKRKDFQKDILPVLATLSRQELMKDLRTIGQSMEAANMPWKTEIRKRKTRGAGVQASRKRQQRSAAAQKSSSTGLVMDDGGTYGNPAEVGRHHIVSWGNAMRRRCRSQRCPPICTSATLI